MAKLKAVQQISLLYTVSLKSLYAAEIECYKIFQAICRRTVAVYCIVVKTAIA